MKYYNILSLGAGVQSSVVLLLSGQGLLPKLDAAIFADTHWEPSTIYNHLWWLTAQATKARIPLFIRSAGNLRADSLTSIYKGKTNTSEREAIHLPLYTLNTDTQKKGILWRECTRHYKVDVVEQSIRDDILGLRKGQRIPADVQVNLWMGISFDEKHRMRVSTQRWRVNHYPLIGWPEQWLDQRWTRTRCEQWFVQNYAGRPLVRSSCIGCPFHNNADWKEMKNIQPADFDDACSFDDLIRAQIGSGHTAYLHNTRRPLRDVDFSASPHSNDSQFLLFEETQECTGMCGV